MANLPNPPPKDECGRHLWECAGWDYGQRGVYQIPKHGLDNIEADREAKINWVVYWYGISYAAAIIAVDNLTSDGVV